MEKDMTQGQPSRIIIAFALPMLIGNIFQQLYNMADTIIVGQCLGGSALAAVGASAAIVFLLLSLAIGLSNGCAVVVAQLFGAGRTGQLRQTVFIAFTFIVGVGLAASLVFYLCSDALLHLIQTPAEIYADTSAYINIYYGGCAFVFAYNALSAICQAIGDSKTPLYFLILTTVLNVGLDLYFILSLNMGVAGAAWATILSQAIAALGLMAWVHHRVPALRVTRGDCRWDKVLFRELIHYAVPSTIQQSIVSISMMAVQGLVNTFGTIVIAGYTAASKIDSLAVQPLLSLNMAVSTFTAQNVGASRNDRVHTGLKSALVMVVAICVVISGLVFFFGRGLTGLFVDAAESAAIVDAGMVYISIVSNCYILMGMMFVLGSVLRGAGDVGAFMAGSLLNFSIRIGAAYGMAGTLGFQAIAWSIPTGWAFGLLFNAIRYKSGRWQSKAHIHKNSTEV